MNHGRRVVAGVLSFSRWVGEHRGTQHIVRMTVGAAHALVDHLSHAHRGAIPAHVHADLQEHRNDAGILTDRAMTLRAHARVDEDLRHGILRGRILLPFVGGVHGLDEVERMIVGDELKGVGDALDQVVLLDRGHGQHPAGERNGPIV